MKNIIESSQLPEGEKVYLKKDWTGWRVVEPITYDARPVKVNNKIDWSAFNWKRMLLGTRKERAFLGFIIFLALISYLAFDEQVANYNLVVNNPCAYCNSCQVHTNEVINLMRLGEEKIIAPQINLSVFD